MTQGLVVLIALVTITWVLELVDYVLLGGWMNSFGIRPRTTSGLAGIFLSPFLHGNLPHLMTNTVPFLTLGFLVMLRGLGTFIGVSLLVIVLGGLGVWIFGRNSLHIGASGLIFGYIGYLLARGYFERSFGSLAIAVLVAVVYGGALWGVLPTDQRISWEGHLFGFLAGVGTAGLLKPQASAAG